MGRMIRIVRVEAVRPNSTGVMAEVIRSNAANDRLRLRVLQCGIQVVRSVRVSAVRPNSIGVMAEMADIIQSNFTKRLFLGIFCRWSEAVHVVRVGSARSNFRGVCVSVTWSNLANCLLGHAIWFEFDWSNFSVGSASNFWMKFCWSSGSTLNFWWKFWINFCRCSRSNCF